MNKVSHEDVPFPSEEIYMSYKVDSGSSKIAAILVEKEIIHTILLYYTKDGENWIYLKSYNADEKLLAATGMYNIIGICLTEETAIIKNRISEYSTRIDELNNDVEAFKRVGDTVLDIAKNILVFIISLLIAALVAFVIIYLTA